MTGRIHRFDALDNFRDYGDYATAAGRRIAPGRLFRSGHQARASAADLDRLGALGEIAALYGSTDGTLQHALGVDVSLRDRIGARLTA